MGKDGRLDQMKARMLHAEQECLMVFADGHSCCMLSRRALWCLQMVIPESDLSTLEKVDASAFNVTTYKAAYTKQVRQTAYQPCKSTLGTLVTVCLGIGPSHGVHALIPRMAFPWTGSQ